LVCFLRQGIIGGVRDLCRFVGGRITGRSKEVSPVARSSADTWRAQVRDAPQRAVAGVPARHRVPNGFTGPILEASAITKRYGGVIANAGIDFTVNQGELRGIIGPNGAGKTTFFKMLTCEVRPTSGKIVFAGRDITGMSVTDVCQLGLTKSYQVNQLFNHLTVRENLTIAVLAELRGKFRLDALGAYRGFLDWASRSSTRWNS
jgi:branched-chain amino acid transport system permease protein